MDEAGMLDVMRRYFQEKEQPAAMERFAELDPKSLLKESLDVVDFVVFLEDELGREIDTTRISEIFTATTFRELAGEVARLMSNG